MAAGQRNVTLPIAANIGAMMGEKMKARDKLLEARGMTGPLPQCRVCGQELAYPYRKAGAGVTLIIPALYDVSAHFGLPGTRAGPKLVS
jgi:hypothetical protein